MLFILLSFTYILTKGFKIAAKASKDGRKYSYYIAYGICSWFASILTECVLNSLAIARAGNICPPVPPAIIKIVLFDT
jgi:cell division protein FtsW (lipid II flippase)